MAMQRFFEFFRRKNYSALWHNLFIFFHLLIFFVPSGTELVNKNIVVMIGFIK